MENEEYENFLQLCENIKTNEEVQVLRQIKKGYHLMGRPADTPPLHLAINSRCPNIVRCLLDFEADVTVKDSEGRTPLLLAILSKNKAAFEVHLEPSRLVINEMDNRGFTPLHGATVIENSWGACQLLLNLGADINAAEDGKCWGTPLITALQLNNTKLAKWLIIEGANISAVDHRGFSVIHLASENSSIEILKFLLKNGENVNVRTACNQTALHIACKSANISTISFLLRMGADVDVLDNEGKTILFHPIETKRFNVIRKILDYCVSSDDTRVHTVEYVLNKIKAMSRERNFRCCSEGLKYEKTMEIMFCDETESKALDLPTCCLRKYKSTYYSLKPHGVGVYQEIYKRRCKREVRKLSKRLPKTSLSFAKLLRMPLKTYAIMQFYNPKLARRICQAYKNKFFKKLFPVYWNKITCKIRKGWTLRKLYIEGMTARIKIKNLSLILNLPVLPLEIMINILKMLSTFELRKLCKAGASICHINLKFLNS